MIYIKFNKQLALVLIFFLSLVAMANFPSKFTIVLSPLINFLLIVYVFKKEILSYDYNGFINNPDSPNKVWNTLMIAVIGQAILNIIMQYVFHINPPNIDFVFNIAAAPIMSVIFSACVEEVIYRKILFKYFESRFGFLLGAIISSVMFMFSHYNYAGWASYFFVGIVW
jgi:hypothetical protein